MLEENLAYAHGGDICVTFATGMAAISGALRYLRWPYHAAVIKIFEQISRSTVFIDRES